MLLLGAGFMLLEVTGVSRAALLYGTTWKVNAYVVGAILSMVLLANLAAAAMRACRHGLAVRRPRARHPRHRPRAHRGLAALPLAVRIVAGGAFLALPVFFSGLVFVPEWAAAERSDRRWAAT